MNDAPIEFVDMTVVVLPGYRHKIIEAIEYFNRIFINGDIKCTPSKIDKSFEDIIDKVDDIRYFNNPGVKVVFVL